MEQSINKGRAHGYSIVDDQTIDTALQKADSLLKVGGTLMLGLNYIDVKEQDADSWKEKFNHPSLTNKYETIFFALGTDNIVYWGKKCE